MGISSRYGAAQSGTMQQLTYHPRSHLKLFASSPAGNILSVRVSAHERDMEYPVYRVIACGSVILARWTLGVLLVSWRYLWATTPLHRSVEAGDVTDLPPPLPDELVDDRSQPLESGVGSLFRRLFAVEIEGSSLTARS
jgi:hypothetical protein